MEPVFLMQHLLDSQPVSLESDFQFVYERPEFPVSLCSATVPLPLCFGLPLPVQVLRMATCFELAVALANIAPADSWEVHVIDAACEHGVDVIKLIKIQSTISIDELGKTARHGDGDDNGDGDGGEIETTTLTPHCRLWKKTRVELDSIDSGKCKVHKGDGDTAADAYFSDEDDMPFVPDDGVGSEASSDAAEAHGVDDDRHEVAVDPAVPQDQAHDAEQEHEQPAEPAAQAEPKMIGFHNKTTATDFEMIQAVLGDRTVTGCAANFRLPDSFCFVDCLLELSRWSMTCRGSQLTSDNILLLW
jgi:hypothetical protein